MKENVENYFPLYPCDSKNSFLGNLLTGRSVCTTPPTRLYSNANHTGVSSKVAAESKKSPHILTSRYVKPVQPESQEDALLLTPLLESGRKVKSIQKLAQVSLFQETHTSYSGFFTVDKTCNSNLFFWFFKCEHEPDKKPLALWLQGGPGSTFLPTLFGGNGPYLIKNGVAFRSEVSWTEEFNVLYIDNPVGTGFSFTDQWSCYSKTVEQAADNLYEALRQFYLLFPQYKKNHLYLTGESYAGKYIVALTTLISGRNRDRKWKKMNIKGLFIGCGFIDPLNQIYYADNLYKNGIINAKQRSRMNFLERSVRKQIRKGNYYIAMVLLLSLSAMIYNVGYWPPVDILNPKVDFKAYHEIFRYAQTKEFRKALHVGKLPLHDRVSIGWHFRKDFLKSVTDHLSEALKDYKVLLYSGQNDMLVPTEQIDQVISHLDWIELKNFNKVETKIWYVGKQRQLAGYTKSWNNLTQAMVLKSNHFVARSQPRFVYDLLKSFVKK